MDRQKNSGPLFLKDASKHFLFEVRGHGNRWFGGIERLIHGPRPTVMNDEIVSYVRTKQPLDGGRVGEPEDLDGAAVWLISDESRFVTGQVVAVDGGWSVCEGQYEA